MLVSPPILPSAQPEPSAPVAPVQNRAVATSLIKALDLLSLLARRPTGMPVTQLVEELGLPRTSVLRMLLTLGQYGLVAKTGRVWQTTDRCHAWAARPRDG